MTKYSIILTTVGTKENALEIARALVEGKFAACVNVVENITSVYFWEGKVCEDGEFLLVIKSESANFEKVKEEILKLHGYELPEIIELGIQNGYEKYLEWISDSLVP